MKSRLDEGIIEGSELMSRGYNLLTENIGKWIAALTALLALLLTFAEVDFLGIGTTELTTSLAVMLISSYVIYFSLEDAGERLGRESEEYIAAREKYIKARERVTGDMLPALREFCLRYTEAELAYRRRTLLLEGGRTEEEYEAWLSGGECPRGARRLFVRARRLSPIALTPLMLLSSGRPERCEVANPERTKALGHILRLIPTTVCALFTASMAISAKDGLDAGAVIEGIIKLGCLPIIGLKGYIEGYNYMRERASAWYEVRERHLSAFLAALNQKTEGGEG